jgi:lysophospholipase L1-like esterase
LETKLKTAGVTGFEFIGGQTGSADCVAQFPGTSNKHEGHSGSLATDFAKNGNLTGWLNAQPAVDVVVMFIGHNDIILGHKPQDQIMAAYDTLISQMRTKNPKMQIVWSNLTPVDPKRWDSSTSPNNSKDVASLSARIKSVATSKSTAQSPVRFVDNFEGYDPVADTEDGEHPNKSGNEKMASKFLSATKDAIKAVSSESGGLLDIVVRRLSLVDRRNRRNL